MEDARKHEHASDGEWKEREVPNYIWRKGNERHETKKGKEDNSRIRKETAREGQNRRKAM